MTKSYQLTEHNGGGFPARYHVDGKRVSKTTFDTIRDKAFRDGRLDCFQTKCRPIGNGEFRRTNWSVAHY